MPLSSNKVSITLGSPKKRFRVLKELTLGQRISLVSLVFLLLSFPVALFLTLSPKIPSQVPATPITPPIPTNPAIGARLYFSAPSPINPQVLGTPFTVDILVDTSNQLIDGIDARIQFDPTVLQVTNVEQGTEPAFVSYPALDYDNTLGTVNVSANIGSGASPTPISGSGLNAGRITFMPQIITGGSQITFDFTPGERNDSNIVVSGTWQTQDPTDILLSVGNATMVVAVPAPTVTPLTPTPLPTAMPTPGLTIVPTVPIPSPTPIIPTPTDIPPQSVTFKLLFQGRLRSGVSNSKPVNITYRQQNGSVVQTISATTNTNGEMITNIVPGNYVFLVNAPGYLARRFGDDTNPVVINQGNLYLDLSATPLSGGDFNDDGEVNEVDYTLYFLSRFLTNDATVDLDGSGEVNNLDFAIMRSNWNLRDDSI